MKAISVQQPWAWAIFHAKKDIENRSRRTLYNGPLAIHAPLKGRSKWAFPPHASKAPEPKDWVLGAIIGIVDLEACVEAHSSKWFEGPFGYVLENPRIFAKPIPCKGQRGIWELDPALLRKCRAATIATQHID